MAQNMKLAYSRRLVDLSCTIAGSDRSDDNSNHSEILGELQEISKEAEETTAVLITEQKRLTSEYEARTAQLESLLAAVGLNRTELNEVAKTAVANAAAVRLACRGNSVGEEIIFAEDTLKATAHERSERSLATKIRRVANRSSRLEKDIVSFRKLIQTPVQIKPASSSDLAELRAETAFTEEKVTILRKKLENLKVPSQSALQNRYDKYIALKEQLNASQQQLKKFDGLPPSLSEAAQKLNDVKKELNNLRLELRSCNAPSFGIDFSI